MSKHSATQGSNGRSPIRSLLAFRHQSRTGRLVSIVAAFAIAMLLAVGIGPAYGVHDTGMFELDGNIAHDGDATYDWGNLFNATGGQAVAPDPNNGPLLASNFNSDAADPDPTYFTSNKDIEPIGDWGCTTLNNPTPKDDLQNAYAALVQIPANAPDNAGHKVLYLASERQSNSGDSFAGFWLLKNKSVGCSGSGAFAGTHTDGDILVLSNYTNGGGTQNVDVYRWTGNDATGSPVAVPGLSGSTCGVSTSDDACAIANTGPITSAWSPTAHLKNTFVEAGIDVNRLVDATGGGCFTNFLAESRSSQQITATLKDFAGGQFNTCPPPPIVTTATPGGSLVAPGTAQHDEATVQAVGGRPTPTGTVKFFLCQPADVTAAGCPSGSGTQVGAAAGVTLVNGSASSVNTTNDTALGKYCWRAEYTPDAAGGNSYVASSHTNASTECFTVVHSSPHIATQISGATGGGAPGLGFTHLGDQATLSNFVGSVTGETVTFSLYGPYATGVTPTCTGTPIATRTGTLNAAGVATTSSTYDPVTVGTYVWVASYDGNSLNDAATGMCSEATERVTVVGAHIDVAKSANPPGPVSAGADIGFDITVSNAGSVPALGTVVHDALPGGADLHWVLPTPYANCAITGADGSQVLNCSLGTVAGATTLPVIHIQSATTPADCGIVSNQASVTTTNGTGGDSDIAHVTVQCAALGFTKTADNATVDAGDQIGFTVTATNSGAAGTGTATGVVIHDPLPAGDGVDWSLASGSGNCSVSGDAPAQTLDCTSVSLAPGESVTAHVVSGTAFISCATYMNTASLTTTNGAPLTASASTTVDCPDLNITKEADNATVDAGDQIGFTVTMGNAGPGTAKAATLSDPLPAADGVDWSIDPAYDGPGTCTVDGAVGTQVLNCAFGDLVAPASVSVHVASATTVASCTTLPNTATLSASNAPSVHDSASVTVQCPVLSLAKVADAASVNAGQEIGFIITARNGNAEGTGTAHGAVINDPLPAGGGVSWSIASGPENCSIQGSAPSQVLVCSALDLAPGASESVHVVSGTTTASCQAYPNEASLTARSNPVLKASATTQVVNCVIVSPPIVSPPHPSVLPNTGGPDEWMLAAGLALLLGGGALVMGDRRRRHRS